MDVIGHDDEAKNVETISFTCLFQDFEKFVASLSCAEDRTLSKTTEVDGMEIAVLLVACKAD